MSEALTFFNMLFTLTLRKLTRIGYNLSLSGNVRVAGRICITFLLNCWQHAYSSGTLCQEILYSYQKATAMNLLVFCSIYIIKLGLAHNLPTHISNSNRSNFSEVSDFKYENLSSWQFVVMFHSFVMKILVSNLVLTLAERKFRSSVYYVYGEREQEINEQPQGNKRISQIPILRLKQKN